MKRHNVIIATTILLAALSTTTMAQQVAFPDTDEWQDFGKFEDAQKKAAQAQDAQNKDVKKGPDGQPLVYSKDQAAPAKPVVLQDVDKPSPTLDSVIKDVALEPDEVKVKKNRDFKTRKTYDYRKAPPPKLLQKPAFDENNSHLPYVTYQMDYTKLLFSAVDKNNIGAVQSLLEKGADINGAVTDSGMNALMLSVFKRHNELMRYLVVKGANVNQTDLDGRTALHIAAQNIDVRNMDFLMTYGADSTVRDKSGKTAIDYLPEGVRGQVLISKIQGQPQLDQALLGFVKSGSVRDAAVVLGKGANVDAKDTNGDTPILLATKAGNTDMAALLLSKGANPLAQDSSRKIPVDYLAQGSDPNMAQLLETYTIRYELEHNIKRPASKPIAPKLVAPVLSEPQHRPIEMRVEEKQIMHEEHHHAAPHNEDRYDEPAEPVYESNTSGGNGFFDRLGRSISNTFSGSEATETVEPLQPINEQKLPTLEQHATEPVTTLEQNSTEPVTHVPHTPRSIVPHGLR